jgi:serine/threonine protein kinase
MSNRVLDVTLEPVLSLPRRFGRYRLTRLLAQGGMAQIYLAKAFGAEGFVKPLVIKRLTPSLTANQYFANLFINEAKLLVTLTHGNIVPVFDFGRVGDDLFMAIEYVNGASLRQVQTALTQMDEQLDRELVAYIGAEVCKGLGYAHRRTYLRGQPAGIVHRDIKPTNVLISLDGEVKIVDFGVAKLAGRVESHGQLTGTIAYMSPEQAERRVVDHRTDIFSTGLLLYEMLTFRRAYDVESPREALSLARRALVPPLPDDVPQELRDIVQRATQREPDQRFASAQEMEMALSDFLLRARAARGGETDSPSGRLNGTVY